MKAVDRLLQRWRIGVVRPYLGPGSRVCDIGCAEGGTLYRAIPHLADGVGLDPDLVAPGAVGTNRLLPGLFPDDLPDDRPFDAITMLAVLEHIPADRQAPLAADCTRHLKPGGRLLITVPAPAVDRILDLLRTLRLIDGMNLEQHYGFEVAQTPAIFGGAGLSLEKSRRFQLGLNNLFVFRKPEDSK